MLFCITFSREKYSQDWEFLELLKNNETTMECWTGGWLCQIQNGYIPKDPYVIFLQLIDTEMEWQAGGMSGKEKSNTVEVKKGVGVLNSIFIHVKGYKKNSRTRSPVLFIRVLLNW